MKKYSQGFIFFMTCMMTSIISLLVLAFMQHLLIYQNTITQQEKRHQQFYQLENIALKLANTRVKASCLTHKDSANEATQILLQGGGCEFKNDKLIYRYYIEELGEFPCLIVDINGQHHATHHQRISIVQLENKAPHVLLQLRFIHPGLLSQCQETKRFVQSGLSSWRYIASID